MAKKRLVKYTSRDFNSIKQDLLDHARQYYPENYNDFNESSFGSMMLDAVSYVGDIMSFYLDYQVNESFLETALDPANVRRIAKQYGYKYYGTPAAYGTATFYVLIPAASTGLGPDVSYIPTLKPGTKIQSADGNVFILTEPVDFANAKNEVVAARFNNTTGKPTSYAIRAMAQVRSGDYFATQIEIGSYQRNLKVRVGSNNINSISSVMDSEGNEYYEVDTLSQDTVYMEIVNPQARTDGVPSLLKPVKVPRRFTVEQDSGGTYLQFGFGSDDVISVTNVVDPSSVALKMQGKNYITDRSFDPKNLLDTNKLGISPSNTTLKVVYGRNDSATVGVSVGNLNNVISIEYDFSDPTVLTQAKISEVIASIEVTNEQIISAETTAPTTDEVKIRSYGVYASQNRAVTKNDYEASTYLMPKKFGSVKRASVFNDPSSTNRRLSLYVISENSTGNLSATHDTVKQNLKRWLNKNRMLNDAIDIYDGKIINIGLEYEITVDPQFDKYGVLAEANARIKENFTNQKMFIAEPFYISSLFTVLNRVRGVIDTKKIKFNVKSGGNYSAVSVNIQDLYSEDGTYLKTPQNCILEIKYPDYDIRGAIR